MQDNLKGKHLYTRLVDVEESLFQEKLDLISLMLQNPKNLISFSAEKSTQIRKQGQENNQAQV